eukprot:3613004-Prorocentrum_lima.AAC.1
MILKGLILKKYCGPKGPRRRLQAAGGSSAMLLWRRHKGCPPKFCPLWAVRPPGRRGGRDLSLEPKWLEPKWLEPKWLRT